MKPSMMIQNCERGGDPGGTKMYSIRMMAIRALNQYQHSFCHRFSSLLNITARLYFKSRILTAE